jgi:hypothetical protein
MVIWTGAGFEPTTSAMPMLYPTGLDDRPYAPFYADTQGHWNIIKKYTVWYNS